MIRLAEIKDAVQIAEIYNYYILNTIVTFEEEIVDAEEIQSRIEAVFSTGFPYLVYEGNNVILGYAYAAPWNKRAAYRHSAETTIYLKNGESSRGLGTLLYAEILHQLKSKNIHTVIGGISLPNKGSQALHEKMGYKKVAHYSEVGRKFGKWIDVGYWQLINNK